MGGRGSTIARSGVIGRRACWAAAATLTLALAASCGGGGGADGGGLSDEPTPPFPSRITYRAGSPSDFGGSGVVLTLATGSIRAGFFLEGTYAKASRAYTLAPHTVPRVSVTATGLPFALPAAQFGILIEETLQWERGSHPSSGRFRIATPNFARLTVVADADGAGHPGALLEQVDFGVVTASASLTWAEIEALAVGPGGAPGYQIQAAFAEDVLGRVFDLLQLPVDGIEFITLHDPELTAAGDGIGITRPCDLFPFTGTAGTRHVTWFDGPGEFPAALGADDHFGVTWQDCWTDESGPAALWVRSGTMNLRNYMENPATVELGFDQVVFDAVVVTRTREAGGADTPVDTATATTFGIGTMDGFVVSTRPDISGKINVTNTLAVASAAVAALLTPHQVGDLALELVAGALADPAFNPCAGGGSFAITPTPQAAMTTGAAFTLAFNHCDTGGADPVTHHGTATVTVTALSGTLGSLTTLNHDITQQISAIAVDTTDPMGTSTMTGATAIHRVATGGNLTEANTHVAPGLATTESGVTANLSAYTVEGTLATTGAFTIGAAGNTLTLDPGIGTGPLALTVTQPVQGTHPAAPTAGGLTAEASDASALTLTVAPGVVTLALDTDGDGTTDDTRTTTWADLY